MRNPNLKKKHSNISSTGIIQDESDYKIICLQNENKANKWKTQQNTSNQVTINKYLILFLGQKNRCVSNSCPFVLANQSRLQRVTSPGSAPLASGTWLVNPVLLKTICFMVSGMMPVSKHCLQVQGFGVRANQKLNLFGVQWCLLGKEAFLCRAYILAVELVSTDIPREESTKDCPQLLKTNLQQPISQASRARRYCSKTEIPEDGREEKANRTSVIQYYPHVRSPLHFLQMVQAILTWFSLGFPTQMDSM